MRRLLLLVLILLVFISGCSNPFNPQYERVCKEIYQHQLNELSSCRNNTKEYISEISHYKYYYISPENFIRDIYDSCLLIITDGAEPIQGDWYNEMGFDQFEGKEMFRVRTWDLERDQIEGYDGEEWEYWLVCDKPFVGEI